MSDDLELALFDDDLVGFRLHRLEVLNWGTFDRTVWALDLHGRNALLTGDIGSGKSTLVDAVTTLLVPRVDYNKAAGAQFRERTLNSYVLGHYKSERADIDSRARPVALRDNSDYSVLLAVFTNEALGSTTTLAQVFWHTDAAGTLGRKFIVADGPRSIPEHFSNFGPHPRTLFAKLRAAGDAVHDSFAAYARDFQRRFGIQQAGALDLLHQTVSMKSVGNLTDFVRQHMLEPPDADTWLSKLIAHFDDLTKAHDAVVDARQQIGDLTPLVQDLDTIADLDAEQQRLRTQREHLDGHFKRQRRELLRARLAERQERMAHLEQRSAKAAQEVQEQEELVAGLRAETMARGGLRVDALRRDINAAEQARDSAKRVAEDYRRVCAQLDLEPADSAEALEEQRRSLPVLAEDLEQQQAHLDNRLQELAVEVSPRRTRLTDLTAELAGLADRDSNIDQDKVLLRQRMCQSLGIDPAALPYAGELLRITDPTWEPAAERLMRGFGISMLVPDEHYRAVSDWVDGNNLSGRLVYYRTRRPETPRQPTDARSLVFKIEVKQGSRLTGWLEAEVARRFDLVCAETVSDFRAAERAITRRGQIKQGGIRHEKDDRHRLGNRAQYVLGWDNREKRAALERELDALRAALDDAKREQQDLGSQRSSLTNRATLLGRLRDLVPDFDMLDWQRHATNVDRLQRELAALEAADDVLAELKRRTAEATADLQDARQRQGALSEKLGSARTEVAQDREACDELDAELASEHVVAPSEEVSAALADRTEAVLQTQAADRLNLKNIVTVEREIRHELQSQIDGIDGRIGTARERTTRAMERFKGRWPLLSQDFDAAVEAGGEYRDLLHRLATDDLPRFEAKFREQLQTNAIRDLVSFKAWLEREATSIAERVDLINDSLRGIDYQPETYIKLLRERSSDIEIREFERDLRACTEGASLGSQEAYSEEKFLQVKELIVRFKGREGRSEQDRRWTQKVTDVRRWFTFAASERLRVDDSEHEHYSDSGGKSGGQKEKLAYTVLAASLAYQFGLVSGQTRSRTFRFVVIDEAFGRGSDESARFGLELFKRMQLQLLVVTPLQKTHVIEPYVSTVGFVHNRGGSTSQLQNIAISDYRSEREEARLRQGVAVR